MLIQLNIKNFALIEDLTVEFKEGFNILSGETGAGKSILIDAIDYVLGGKFSKELIRTGEERTFVEAIFTIDNDKVKETLNELEIEFEDILIISRDTTLSGKGIIKINGKSVIVTQLKKVREKILDIHGQHQNTNLLQKSLHIHYLDNFIDDILKEPLKDFSKLREELILVRDKIANIKGNGDNEKLIDYTKFQIDDIEKAKIKMGEEEELKEEYNILSNAERINNGLKLSTELLNSREDGNSVLESLSKVINEFQSMVEHMESLKEKKVIIEEAYYSLEEVSRDIRDIGESIHYDEARLSKINERIYEINNYKKKYGPSVLDILEYNEKLKNKYKELINSEEVLKELKDREDTILSKMRSIGLILHDIRSLNSDMLEKKILKELSYVGLEKSDIKIQVKLEEHHNERGFDSVNFLITTNPGEPLKPLEKVLSGGELSRIMLAFKCVFADKEDISTLIFDEIDTGISGTVGQRVGEKMYQVSLGHQVLCITHLPQIAILSDNHYFVSKDVKNLKTFTKIKLLNKKEKIMQIASMMGGQKVTESTIQNVEEMLGFADTKKSEIKIKKNT